DIHKGLRDAEADIFPYLSKGWQEFVLAPAVDGTLRPTNVVPSLDPGGRNSVMPRGLQAMENPFGFTRKDAFGRDGSPPGSSPELMIEQLLDPFEIEVAILTGGEVGLHVAALSNPYFQVEVARACNDQLVDHWLSVDPRFRGSVSAAMQVPESAAEEARRRADDPRFVQVAVCTNPHAYPFGHPIYDPVHRV